MGVTAWSILVKPRLGIYISSGLAKMLNDEVLNVRGEGKGHFRRTMCSVYNGNH